MKSTTKKFLIFIGFGLVFILSTIKDNNYPPKNDETIISLNEQDVINDLKFPNLSAERDLADEWNQTWGGSGHDYVSDLAMDSSENIYLTGIDGTSGGIFLLKYDKNGVLQWDRNFVAPPYWPAREASLAIDSQDNIIITAGDLNVGTYVHIFKYNSSGDFQWNKVFVGDSGIFIYDIALDSSDNILLSGLKDDDVLVLIFNTTGEYQWNITWGGIVQDYAKTITLDAYDNIYIAGCNQSGALIDGILVKFDDVGNYKWNRSYGLDGGDNREIFMDIKLDSLENIYVVGDAHANVRGFLVKYDKNGIYQWNITLPIRVKNLVIDSSDDIFILGFGAESLLMKVNSSGIQQWNCTTFGYDSLTGRIGMGIDSSDNVYIASRIYVPGDTDVGLTKYSSKPKITIHSPEPYEFYTDIAPYNISIFEPDISSRWYTLDNGTTNTTFTDLIGTIDPQVWSDKEIGYFFLTFYANDTYGNIGSCEVRILKWYSFTDNGGGGSGGGGGGGSSSKQEANPGYSLFVLLGIVCMITILLAKKRWKLTK